MRRPVVLAILAALAVPGSAVAGGWATVAVTAPPGDAVAGKPRPTDVLVMQHGRTPLQGVVPKLVISKAGQRERSFPARPARKPGLYRANLVFPVPGTWSVRVDDGFSAVHKIAPVKVVAAGEGSFAPAAAVAPPAGGGDSGSSSTPALIAGGAIVALIAAVAGFLLLRKEPGAGDRDLPRSPRPSAS